MTFGVLAKTCVLRDDSAHILLGNYLSSYTNNQIEKLITTIPDVVTYVKDSFLCTNICKNSNKPVFNRACDLKLIISKQVALGRPIL